MGCDLSKQAIANLESETAAAEKDCAEVRVSSLAVGGMLEDHGLVSYAIAKFVDIPFPRTDSLLTQEVECLRAKGTAMIRKLAKEKGANAVLGFSSSISGGEQGGSLVMLFQGTAVTLQNSSY